MTQEHIPQMFFLSVTHQAMSKNLLGFVLTPLKLLTKCSPYGCKVGLKFRGWLYYENAFLLPTNAEQFLNASWQLALLAGCGAAVPDTLPSAADLAEAEPVICWCWQSLSGAAAALPSANAVSAWLSKDRKEGGVTHTQTRVPAIAPTRLIIHPQKATL